MHARTVAQGIHEEVTEHNLQIFRNRYLETDYTRITNAEFRRAMEFAQSLSESDRATFMEILRQVIVDTASTVLGVFEGSVVPAQVEGTVSVLYDDHDISDEIQTAFLVIEEEYQESVARES